MKKMMIYIIILILLSLNTKANENQSIAVSAGIALITAVTNANKEDMCTQEDYKNYKLNMKMYASPANSMIDYKHNICVSKVLFLINDINIENIAIKQMEPISYTKEDNGNLVFNIISSVKRVNGKRKSRWKQATINNKGIAIKMPSVLEHLIGKKLFEMKDKIILKQSTFSQEIIYNGIENSIIHLLYREFNGKFIRDAFTQELIFDLSKGNIIQIKEFKLNILSADNEKITYKILD